MNQRAWMQQWHLERKDWAIHIKVKRVINRMSEFKIYMIESIQIRIVLKINGSIYVCTREIVERHLHLRQQPSRTYRDRRDLHRYTRRNQRHTDIWVSL